MCGIIRRTKPTCANGPTKAARWQRAARLFRELLTPFDARLSAQRGTNLDRARLEATLARQREALELADAELLAFSRGVSHDLMAPLRSISSFTQEVIDAASAALDLRSRKYLDYVRDAASEMTRQVEGMLALARVSGGELEQSPVDLGSLASEAAQRLLRAEPLRRVEFVLADAQTNGGLLASVPARGAQKVLEALHRKDVPAALIGEVHAGRPSIEVVI